MPPDSIVSASAPTRVDLAGGTLDLWPLHVLHPGSVTVNLAINLHASCRVRLSQDGLRILSPDQGRQKSARDLSELLEDPATALVGSLLEALEIRRPLEVELRSGVPFGSGLGGSSALTVALMGALERFGVRRPSAADPVGFVRDVETRVLGKPAGVQDYYPPLEGGLYRARMEGDRGVAEGLEAVRRAATRMAEAVSASDFEAMGEALRQEWEARRRLAPVVSTPLIERAIGRARRVGAWGGKACGAGGGGCIVILSPAEKTAAVREALAGLGEGALLSVRAENLGLTVSAGY